MKRIAAGHTRPALGAGLLVCLAAVCAHGDSLRIGCPTGEIQIEWANRQGTPWVELEGLARAAGIQSHWDPLTRRQEYLYPGHGPVVFIDGSRLARLGETLSLMPMEPRREQAQFWAPWPWVVDVLLDYWGLRALEEPPQAELPPAERPERISDLIAAARLSQASAAQGPGRLVVMLDPAHGGEDTGSVSLSNVREADVAMDYALALARALRREDAALEVLFTRRGPQSPTDEDRCGAANRAGADVLVSLHCGARRTRIPGLWVFYMSDLADSPHALDLGGADRSLPVWELGYLPHQERSRRLAQSVATGLKAVDRPDPRVMPARLRILRSVDMPAVLIELGNLGDEAEVVRLSSESERESIARDLAQTLVQFLSREPTP